MAARPDAYGRRVVIAVATAAFAVLLVLAVWAAMHMLLLIFGGILLAVLLRALGEALSRHTRIPLNVSVWIVAVVLFGTLGIGGWYLSAELTEQFDELGRSLTEMGADLRSRLENSAIGQEILGVLGAQQVSEQSVSAISRTFAAVLGGVSGLVISVFIGLYVAGDPGLYQRGFLRLVPVPVRPHANDVLEELHETLRSWLLGTFSIMIVVGLLTTIGLTLLGIPLALALGIIAFLLEFIPYVGPILAAIPAVLVASAMGSQEVLFVVLLYWGIQTVEGYVLSPLVYQRSVHIPPMLTIGAQVVLATLLGVVGVIFATPLTACAMVLVQRLYVEDVLGDRLERRVKTG
jgi:predicted PurR-regulated permease PerM